MIDGRALVATVSIGVSMFPRDGATMGELLKHSDTAMYQAKDLGRNNFQVFSPQMDRTLKERVAIESSLRAALKLQQFDVHYQPIIDIHSRRVAGLEALLRWKHPDPGLCLAGALHRGRRGNRPHHSDRPVRARPGRPRHQAHGASRARTWCP